MRKKTGPPRSSLNKNKNLENQEKTRVFCVFFLRFFLPFFLRCFFAFFFCVFFCVFFCLFLAFFFCFFFGVLFVFFFLRFLAFPKESKYRKMPMPKIMHLFFSKNTESLLRYISKWTQMWRSLYSCPITPSKKIVGIGRLCRRIQLFQHVLMKDSAALV